VAFNDDYLNTVVFICAKPRADEWEPVGTGFFVNVPWTRPNESGYFHRYLVTAKHVADHAEPGAIRVRHVDGHVSHSQIGLWAKHARSDIAVTPVDTLPPGAIGKSIPEERFSDKWPHDTVLRPGDVAYFIGLLGDVASMKDNNIPMVRSGRVGARSQTDIRRRDGNVTGKEPLAHLIDTYSQSGFSGAPCFIEQPLIVQPTRGKLAIGSASALDGVVVGHFDGYTEVWHDTDLTEDTGLLTSANKGIAIVVPVELLRELIEKDDELAELRMDAEKEQLE
jgi:hypothetical protein